MHPSLLNDAETKMPLQSKTAPKVTKMKGYGKATYMSLMKVLCLRAPNSIWTWLRPSSKYVLHLRTETMKIAKPTLETHN